MKNIFLIPRTNDYEQEKDVSMLPDSLYIRLNRICNLSCPFCLASGGLEGLTTEEIKKVLLILKSSGVKKVKLTGGEPSLRTDLFEIIDFCIELGLSASVYSNLYVSSNVVDRLLNYPISISTSIHGTEFYHDSVTKMAVSTLRC